MTPLRIAFIGSGNMGQCAHLVNYVGRADCQVVALAERREGLGRQVAARWGVPAVYPDHSALLAHEQVDALVCVQQFSFHGQTLPDLLGTGKPLMTEKPMASSVATAENLLAVASKNCTESGQPSWAVAYHKRSDPAIVYARQIIQQWKASGEMGPLRYVRLTMPPGDWIAAGMSLLLRSDEPVPPGEPDPPQPGLSGAAWKHYRKLVNYYVHQVNLLRHLLGESYRVTFADRTGVLMAVESASGVCGTIEMNPYRTTLDWQEEALVAFARGWIRVRLPAPLTVNRPGEVEVFTDGGDRTSPQVPMLSRPSLPWVHAMKKQADHFIEHCQGKPTPLCLATEAIEDLIALQQYLTLYMEAGGTLPA